MTLGEHDHIVGAWAETPSGPGWSNRLVWVCIYSALDGSHRVDCFQPDEQTEEMIPIFPICVVTSNALLNAARRAAEQTRKPRKRVKR